MQRLGYVDREIKETKQKSGYFYTGHRNYNTQNLGVPVGGPKDYFTEKLG